MLLGFTILGIALLSIAVSYMSIRSDMKKGKHVEEVKKKLQKGRVLFYSPSSSSGSDS